MYNVSMHIKKLKHKKEHPFFSIAGIFVIIAAIMLGWYYYIHSPIYTGEILDDVPAVRGATTNAHEKPVVTAHKSLTIRIPDSANVIIEDFQGRKSQSHDFQNDIPFSDVLIGEDGSRSIVISEMLAAKYTLHVSGFAEKEAIAVEIDNVETGVQTELIPVTEGASYVVTLSPLMIESSQSQNAQ